MEIDDLPGVFALGEKVFTPELSLSLYRTWDESELVASFATDGETCLVAELDQRIVGFAIGTVIDKRGSPWSYGWLTWLAVEPELAGAGIGRRLVKRLTELFIEYGARMMLVDTDAGNARALEFFQREGFGNLTRHVYLWKNLTQQAGYQRRRAGPRKRGTPRIERPRPPLPEPEESASDRPGSPPDMEADRPRAPRRSDD